MSSQNRAVLYVTVIFLTGVVAGALLMNLVEHLWMHPARPQAANWSADRQHYLEEYRRQLSLSDEQSRQLDQILDETMKQYLDLHSFSHHIRDDGLARIRAILNDDQRKQFDQLTRKVETDEQKKAKKGTR